MLCGSRHDDIGLRCKMSLVCLLLVDLELPSYLPTYNSFTKFTGLSTNSIDLLASTRRISLTGDGVWSLLVTGVPTTPHMFVVCA